MQRMESVQLFQKRLTDGWNAVSHMLNAPIVKFSIEKMSQNDLFSISPIRIMSFSWQHLQRLQGSHQVTAFLMRKSDSGLGFSKYQHQVQYKGFSWIFGNQNSTVTKETYLELFVASVALKISEKYPRHHSQEIFFQQDNVTPHRSLEYLDIINACSGGRPKVTLLQQPGNSLYSTVKDFEASTLYRLYWWN